jgi:hypothetical protein
MSPGRTNSRGVLTFFNNSCFENILLRKGDPNGRATWVIGEYNKKTEIFVSIYAPNSGQNAEYYLALLKETKRLCDLYNVHNIYVLGDFNIDLVADVNSLKRHKQKGLHKRIRKSLKKIAISTVSDKYLLNTWNHGDKFSRLDFILISKHLLSVVKRYDTLWGIDRSDHAAIELIVDINLDKGAGMYRPDTSFLDNPSLADDFRNEFTEQLNEISDDWDPHLRLEYIKMSIRTLLGVYSKKFNNNLNRNLDSTRSELNKLIGLKQSIALGKVFNISLSDCEADISICQSNLNKLLAEKSKYLASRARVQWLEKGERSNKYFLNIIHKQSYNSYINQLFSSDGTLSEDNEDKLCIAYDFYSNLYQKSNCINPDSFFLKFEAPIVDNAELDKISAPLSIDMLTCALKSCGNTAAGPDGIGYKVLKIIWDLYCKYLLESWNHGLKSGTLAPSHRESVICLLEKKGKDRRYIQNLRPISSKGSNINSLAVFSKFNF